MLTHFLDHVQELSDVRARVAGRADTRSEHQLPDAEIELSIAGRSIRLAVETKKDAYPRDVRQGLWRSSMAADPAAPGVQRLFLAESISPGAKELLRQERVAYCDRGGSLFLSVPGAYIHIDKPPPKALEKAIGSMFSGRRAQVLHALLMDHKEWFGVVAMANRAQVAASTVSDVLAGLERFDWLESRGKGPGKERLLREPGALLDEWARQISIERAPAVHRYYVPGHNAGALADRLDEVCKAYQISYALSSEAAAQRYAPFLSNVSQVRTRLLPGNDTDDALTELGARNVHEGANLVVIDTKSAGELLFRQQIDGVWLASPIQVYLDLLRGEGRAKEMAEHLRRERIGY
ncbi:type IV toxin-antitoxin system AbiEi family antitoxin [Bordetella sp. LUAb4]|uniref:type IV toxin-antitoxin system AbiEi family antitoxin n=1 Tax=Bordetella sp. LUAb4 TaxID=2843195 RepID=UPI001E4E80AE|nr:type IV toxin-antitoxin system AbiEi family antitoxin [Bordetella sp. LUAb4]